jgi:hypothetical protein
MFNNRSEIRYKSTRKMTTKAAEYRSYRL